MEFEFDLKIKNVRVYKNVMTQNLFINSIDIDQFFTVRLQNYNNEQNGNPMKEYWENIKDIRCERYYTYCSIYLALYLCCLN